MKDFSNWLEAWKNYPPVPDWLNILGTIVIGSPSIDGRRNNRRLYRGFSPR